MTPIESRTCEVERGNRSVTIDELFALMLALETNLDRLLRTSMDDARPGLDIGWERGPLVPVLAHEWMHGERPRIRIQWSESEDGPLFDLKPLNGVTSEASTVALRLLGSEPEEPAAAHIVAHSQEIARLNDPLTDLDRQRMQGLNIEEVMERHEEQKQDRGAEKGESA